MPTLKVVGRAVARIKGYYPTPGGPCASVQPGATFEVLEGYPVQDWADMIVEPPPPPAAPSPPAGKTKTKTKTKTTPPAGDIA